MYGRGPHPCLHLTEERAPPYILYMAVHLRYRRTPEAISYMVVHLIYWWLGRFWRCLPRRAKEALARVSEWAAARRRQGARSACFLPAYLVRFTRFYQYFVYPPCASITASHLAGISLTKANNSSVSTASQASFTMSKSLSYDRAGASYPRYRV